MDLTFGAFVFCLVVVGVFFALWFYYDRRDHALYEVERRRFTFHCIRCDKLYTVKRGAEVAPCPRCGYQNTRLKF